MANQDIITPVESAGELPVVRSIGIADLREALARGFDDFRAMPTHVIFLSLIYPIVGRLLGRATLGYEGVPLRYPRAAGFALSGPVAAVGLDERGRGGELGVATAGEEAWRATD